MLRALGGVSVLPVLESPSGYVKNQNVRRGMSSVSKGLMAPALLLLSACGGVALAEH
jgi:hypothetical protein